MAAIARVVAVVAGLGTTLWVLASAIRTVVLPRGEQVLLTRLLFTTTRWLFDLRLRRVTSYRQGDHIMARYAPITLVLLPAVWIVLVSVAFTAVFWGLGVDPLLKAFELSGSSLLTLGFVGADSVPRYIASFAEATMGLGLVALLISYLPTIYSSFQRRELLVARMATRAGDPPSSVEMIVRHHLLARLDALDDIWDDFETWFADIEETHTSQPALAFFRSISHERSWVTVAGVVLDAAAFRASVLHLPSNPECQLCIRAGYLSLRRIADFFDIPHDPTPDPGDPISITRAEFDAAYAELAAAGVPVRPDRERCWQDWRGWRVNYDAALLGLAGLVLAPYAAWSSDRSIHAHHWEDTDARGR